MNTQRSFADVAAALAAAEAELQRLRSVPSACGDAEEVAVLRAAAAAEQQRRAALEGEVHAWREREAAASAGVDASRDEVAKHKDDLSKWVAACRRAPHLR